MTIHDTHPFADPDPDPARRLRGRLTGTVALLTADRAAVPAMRAKTPEWIPRKPLLRRARLRKTAYGATLTTIENQT